MFADLRPVRAWPVPSPLVHFARAGQVSRTGQDDNADWLRYQLRALSCGLWLLHNPSGNPPLSPCLDLSSIIPILTMAVRAYQRQSHGIGRSPAVKYFTGNLPTYLNYATYAVLQRVGKIDSYVGQLLMMSLYFNKNAFST